ncbi:MAG: hypothetical protein RLZZ458_1245, partial [Planctomycetota bacterium]
MLEVLPQEAETGVAASASYH